MTLETKFVRLRQPVPLGQKMEDGWRVCWLGGWDKSRLFFIVMVVRQPAQLAAAAQRGARRRSG